MTPSTALFPPRRDPAPLSVADAKARDRAEPERPARPVEAFRNPIVPGDHPDPAVLKDGADDYMSFSSWQHYPGAVIWHSRDLAVADGAELAHAAGLGEMTQGAGAISASGRRLATAIDVGDAVDIHPRNKRAVGQRLAALAMHELGLRAAPATGPRLTGQEARGGEFELRFDTTAGGLRTARTGEPLRGFYLAGADRRWTPAEARFDGDRIVLRSAAVPSPVAARYAWVNNASEANIVGGDGLPLPPLRTDDWPLESAGRRYGR